MIHDASLVSIADMAHVCIRLEVILSIVNPVQARAQLRT